MSNDRYEFIKDGYYWRQSKLKQIQLDILIYTRAFMFFLLWLINRFIFDLDVFLSVRESLSLSVGVEEARVGKTYRMILDEE